MTAIPGTHTATERISRIFLWVVLGLFLAKGILIALTGAPYSGHDEIAHISYVKIVAEEGRLPQIPDLSSWREARQTGGDTSFDQIPDEYYRWAGHFTTPDWLRQQLVIPREAEGDEGEWFPSGWIYTANHPPLYYLWLAPVEKLTDHLTSEQQSYVFRLATIPFGLGTVVFAWLAARSLFRHDLFMRLLVPTFVAMQPQIAYEAAIVNNDIVAIMFCSGMFWLLIEGLRSGFTWKLTSWLGVLFGLAMLGKTTSASMALLVAFAMIAGIGWRSWREWLPKGLAVAAIAAAMLAPWQWFMLRTYGNPTALTQISDLQSWWNDRDEDDLPTLLGQFIDPTFFWFRWKETWGEFGWRLIELDGYMAEVYGIGDRKPLFLTVILLLTLVGTAGVGVWLWRIRGAGEGTSEVFRPQQWQWIALGVMLLACAVGYFSVLQFGLTFSLTQARYYFPMIVPAAILLMLGFRALAPNRLVRMWGAVVFLGLVVLNILIYTAWFLPYWHPMAGSAVH